MNCGCIGLRVPQTVRFTLFSVHLRVGELFEVDIIAKKQLVITGLFGHKASDVVFTQTTMQLTLGRNMSSSWVSPCCNPLPQEVSSGLKYKSFSCVVGWPQVCGVLLTGIHCIIVNDHVGRGIQNWQRFLSSLTAQKLKQNASDTSRRSGPCREGGWEFTLGGTPFDPPFYFQGPCCVRLVARNREI
jgi:hypothetical protein